MSIICSWLKRRTIATRSCSASKRAVSTTLLGQRWRELGYVEGETVLLRTAQGDVARMPALVSELVGLGVGVLVVVGLPAIKAALSTAPGTPVVAIDLETDPVWAGL